MNAEFSINDRIIQLITQEGMTFGEFAKAVGVPPASISQLKAHRNKPSVDFLAKLSQFYSDIDYNWLFTGVPSVGKTAEFVQNSPQNENSAEIFNYKHPSLFSQPVIETSPRQSTQTIKTVESVQQRKRIEKIVTFYSDKTFSEYYPE